jgi:hypothetical protein
MSLPLDAIYQEVILKHYRTAPAAATWTRPTW